ncbi:hypothetical protein ACIRBY_31910 [Streptomyces sp. NPDC096136]|uniref:hypothetical protein n=1 Tax=Streptomyces sp. NPDC096136 TaxID=3366076 RepID=UPI0038269159
MSSTQRHTEPLDVHLIAADPRCGLSCSPRWAAEPCTAPLTRPSSSAASSTASGNSRRLSTERGLSTLARLRTEQHP